jgi:DNA-binding NtrC family response regulator
VNPVRILIVDDDENMGRACSRLFKRMGLESEWATSGAAGLERLSEDDFDMILSDLVMPQMDGIDFLRKVRRILPDLPFIVMTGFGTIQSAVAAMKEGATNYITKPFDRDELEAAVRTVLAQRQLEGEVNRLRQELEVMDPAPDLIGRSPPMMAVKDLIRAAARTTSPVFVVGPSGTGKELVARAIHERSSRSKGAFVPVNCGALPEGLAESELFGNVKGAYTGAGIAREGLFRSAHGGTIFLDEIGEMPVELQVKLLRVLQERAVRPVGGTREVAVNVRVVAATNQSPQAAIQEGRLREDLYYRLAVLTLDVPPLQDRKEDVALLASSFVRSLHERYGDGPVEISPEALKVLEGYSWPGNVRELENVLDQIFALGRSGVRISVDDLPALVRGAGGSYRPPLPFGVNLGPTTFKEGEAVLIRQALINAKGNKTQAAKALGISRPLLYKRIKEYGIDLDS